MLNALRIHGWTMAAICSRSIYYSLNWTTLFCGFGAGWVLISAYQTFLIELGSSSPVLAAMWAVSALAWMIAWNRPVASSYRSWLIPSLLAASTVLNPMLWQAHGAVLSDTTGSWAGVTFAYATGWALVTLALPVACAARVALQLGPQPGLIPSGLYLFGASLGFLLGPAANLGNAYLTSICACTLVGITLFIKGRQASQAKGDSNAIEHGRTVGEQSTLHSGTWSTGERIALFVLCGGLLVWAADVFSLALVVTLYTCAAFAVGITCGMSMGFTAARISSNHRKFLTWGSLLVVATSLALTAGFTNLLYRLITLSGTVSQAYLLQGCRDLLVAMVTVPLGMLWAFASLSSAVESTEPLVANRYRKGARILTLPGSGIAWAALGGILMHVAILPRFGMTNAGYGALFLIAAIVIRQVIASWEFPSGVIGRLAFTSVCLGLISAPFLSSGIRPELASRLLFSTNVYLSERNGVPRAQLPFLDDARLTMLQPAEHGVITVWKSAVARYQIRENGIPLGTISTNGSIAPQASAEILTALLPLTLHEEPREVALLGAGAGMPMTVSLSPQESNVTVVESDRKLVSMVQSLTEKTELANFWQDKRLTHLDVDPAVWVASRGRKFDVVISNPYQAALLKSAPVYTQEFYRRAAKRLTADGIFCQRFAFHDFGPGPIQTLSATLRSVFQNVMAVEIGPSEMVFIATNSDRGLIRSGITERMQAIFATEAMASIGWDWTVMLTLAAYDAEHLEKIEGAGSQKQNTAKLNTAMNGWFCTHLPPELMRWGAKGEEVSRVLAPNSGKILNWLGEVSNRDDLLRRLSEVKGQQDLLMNYPDQYWAYRAQVRKQVSTRPMSLVQKVKHEDGPSGLPPEDKRRLRYFQQLSKAIHTKQPQEFSRLETYVTPYDPLVSLFVHQELAEIAARSPQINPQLELEHRLHTLFFTSTNDRSVRNGLAALKLVIEKPESIPAGVDRFDLLNTILQSLQYRWESRSTAAPGDAIELARDVEMNIVLCERALKLMRDCAADSGVSAADCQARERVIERGLLHPLRNYRTRLAPHISRQKMKQEAEIDGGLPTDEELQFPGADKL